MFMRLLHLSINGEYEKIFSQFYNTIVLPQLQKMDGCKMAGLIKSNSDKGKFISLTLWDEENQAERYEKSKVYENLTEQVSQFLSESSEWKVQLSDDYKLEYKPVPEAPFKANYAVAVKTSSTKSSPEQPSGMYVRIVSVKIQSGMVEEFRDIYSKEIIPALGETKGCTFAYLTENMQEENEFLSISVWEDKSFADEYEANGRFEELTSKVKHTFSKFYLWKMELEQESKGKVETSEDMKIDNYTMVTGKGFN
jgi:quinol monooxygenase YgiN